MAGSRRIDAALLWVAAVWGSSYLAAKVAGAAMPVLDVLLLRYALSALACLALIAVRRPGRARPWITRDEGRAGALLGMTQAAVLVLETFGVAHTSAANAGLIISLTIVLTPMLDRAGGQARLPGQFYLAAGVSVIGVVLLVSATGFRAPGLGDALMVAAAVVRAAHVALVGRLTSGRPVRPLALTTVQTLIGALLFAVAAAPQLPAVGHIDAGTFAVLAYLALFCSVFAFVVQTWAVQHTSASRASLLLGTEPVWAVAAGLVIGGEHLTAIAVAGAVLVIAGAYRGQIIERRHRTCPVEPAVALITTTRPNRAQVSS